MVATVAASEGVGLCANASAVTEATAVNTSENATNDFFMNTPSACGGNGAYQNGSDRPATQGGYRTYAGNECPIAHSADRRPGSHARRATDLPGNSNCRAGLRRELADAVDWLRHHVRHAALRPPLKPSSRRSMSSGKRWRS